MQVTTPEQRQAKKLRVCYKIKRRMGYARVPALQRAIAQVSRLNAAFAIAESADYKISVVRLAKAQQS